MKIVRKIREHYDEKRQIYESLGKDVEELLKHRVEKNGWFFRGRIKQPESFALKIETGRVNNPLKLEDFYACTILVPTMAEINEAEDLVMDFFDFSERRPGKNNFTHKQPYSFDFDDLRLYVSRRQPPSGLRPELTGLVFEVQIQTFLQQAWSVATHDLIYKSDSASWPKERIAYQVKAMLEHAEVAIAEVNRLADSPAIAKENKFIFAIEKLILQIKQTWPEDNLPKDIKRLATIFWELLRTVDRDAAFIPKLIEDEKNRLGMTRVPANLSPYAFFVQALAQSKQINFMEKFNRKKSRARVFIHADMDLPDWMTVKHEKIIKIEEDM